MPALYDNSIDIEDFAVTTLTTPAFTISGANRAAILGIFTVGNSSAWTASCGGVSGTQSPNTNVNFNSLELVIFEVIAPATGSQTATASWTGADSASLTALTFTGVHQTTPTSNGGTATGNATMLSKVVTSNVCDMTCSLCTIGTSDESQIATGSHCTQRQTAFAAMDTGPGTGTTQHTWMVVDSQDILIAGINVLAALTCPTITVQPAPQHVYATQTATFTIAATGTGTVHYQWKQNGLNVGTDTDTFAIVTANIDDRSAIQCVITDDNTSITSEFVSLTVTAVSEDGT